MLLYRLYLIRPIEKYVKISCNLSFFNSAVVYTFTKLLCVIRLDFPSIVLFVILLMLSPVCPWEMRYQV